MHSWYVQFSRKSDSVMGMSSLNPFLLNTTGSSVTASGGTVMTIPSHCRQQNEQVD